MLDKDAAKTPHSISHSSGVDRLVLSTVNAPYRRSIDAPTLAECLARKELGAWAVHIATFFTDVSTDLIFEFVEHHGISERMLAEAYSVMKVETGEANQDLETRIVSLASAAR